MGDALFGNLASVRRFPSPDMRSGEKCSYLIGFWVAGFLFVLREVDPIEE